MAHNIQDIEIHHEGDAHEIVTTVVEDTPDADPVDISMGEAKWLLTKDEKLDDVEAELTKEGEDGADEDEIEFTDPENGELTIIIETGDTDEIVDWNEQPGNSKTLHHRLRVWDADGRRVTTFTGDFTIYR